MNSYVFSLMLCASCLLLGIDSSAQSSTPDTSVVDESSIQALGKNFKARKHHALKELIDLQQVKKQSLLQQTKDIENIQLSIEQRLYAWTQALEVFIRADLPFYEEERIARIESLKQLIANPSVSHGERLRKLLEAYLVEAEFGASIDTYSTELEVGGVPRQVEVTKMGRLALVFQSDDQSLFGIYHPGKRIWQPLPEKYRNDIRRMTRFAKKQAPPSMLVIPVVSERP